jgi:hypothetical protein
LIEKSRYVAERKHRFLLGMKRWTDEYIRRHVINRYATFRSLRKHGYDTHKATPPIQILKSPLWSTRFACTANWLGGREIYNGAGRCAAAVALGWESIPVQMVEDARKPGDKGKFEKKIGFIKGVW